MRVLASLGCPSTLKLRRRPTRKKQSVTEMPLQPLSRNRERPPLPTAALRGQPHPTTAYSGLERPTAAVLQQPTASHRSLSQNNRRSVHAGSEYPALEVVVCGGRVVILMVVSVVVGGGGGEDGRVGVGWRGCGVDGDSGGVRGGDG